MENLNKLFLTKIKSLYDIELELINSLPKLAEAATDKNLKKGFEDHLKETEGQAKRLEKIFKLLDEKPSKLKVEAIRGLAKDAEWLIDNVEEGGPLDLSLITAASSVEHYEIAGYNGAIMLAEQIEEDEAIDLLEMTLSEEEAADTKLVELAGDIAERLK
jgi:ferritin-like metal-binding protein YciE